MSPEIVLLLVFPAAMAFAAASDLLTMTIPNRVSLVLVARFAVAAIVVGLPTRTVALHIASGAMALLIGFVMFARGWLGGGDAKLLASASLWLGFENLPQYGLLVSLAGGVLALSILLYRAWLPPLFIPGPAWALRLHDRNVGIPYGIALAAAALWIYPSTHWFTLLAGR